MTHSKSRARVNSCGGEAQYVLGHNGRLITGYRFYAHGGNIVLKSFQGRHRPKMWSEISKCLCLPLFRNWETQKLNFHTDNAKHKNLNNYWNLPMFLKVCNSNCELVTVGQPYTSHVPQLPSVLGNLTRSVPPLILHWPSEKEMLWRL